MNDKLLKTAQSEYQRQYSSWLQEKPNEKSILEMFENVIKKCDELEDEDDISPCPKCGCETVIPKDDNYICEKCSVTII